MNNKIQKQLAVMWIIRQGFYLYINGQTTLLSLGFSNQTVRYFDIIDEIKFQSQIDQFIKQNKLPALQIYIIVGADALVEKEVQLTNEVDMADEEKKFIDLVPYENIYSRTWKQDKTAKIVAINADIYKDINNVIEKNEGHVESIIPYFVTGQPSFNLQIAQSLLKRLDLFKDDNMIRSQTYEEKGSEITPPEDSSTKGKSTLPILLPVFMLLIVILVVVVVLQFSAPQSTKSIKQNLTTPSPLPKKVLSVTPFPIGKPEPTIASPAAQLKRENITIIVQNNSDDPSKAINIRQLLIRLGYMQININESSQKSSQKNTVIFKSPIEGRVREEIYTGISESLEPLTIQENDSIDADVLILITNSS
jgi:hypothetical protein